MKTYAGVGSRSTPIEVGHKMVEYAERLAKLDYVLVSGGARKKKHAPPDVVSADHVFEYGAAKANGKMIIYRAFVNKFVACSADAIIRVPNDNLYENAVAFIKHNGIIPWFDKMTSWAKLLHARNYYQNIQENGHKVDFVIAYAPLDEKGEPMGGTRTAIKIAHALGVKCYNLALPMDAVMVEQHITDLEKEHGTQH